MKQQCILKRSIVKSSPAEMNFAFFSQTHT